MAPHAGRRSRAPNRPRSRRTIGNPDCGENNPLSIVQLCRKGIPIGVAAGNGSLDCKGRVLRTAHVGAGQLILRSVVFTGGATGVYFQAGEFHSPRPRQWLLQGRDTGLHHRFISIYPAAGLRLNGEVLRRPNLVRLENTRGGSSDFRRNE
jgi:hypothetical protein